MKEIEKIINVFKEQVKAHGSVYTGYNLPVVYDDDMKLSIPNWNSFQAYSATELSKMHPEERKIVEKWTAWRKKNCEEYVELFNESISVYYNYCGKRAGEPFLLDLVMQGYNIGNVLSFNPAKVLAKSGSKKCQR